MSVEDNIRSLEIELKKAEEWLNHQRKNEFTNRILDYPNLENLTQCISDFFNGKPTWNKRTEKVADLIAKIDPFQNLIDQNPSGVFELMNDSALPLSFMMYLLNYVRRFDNRSDRIKIACYLLHQIENETIKDEALVSLAREGWEETENYVKVLWDSNDITKRMTALKAVYEAKSPMLVEFIDMATNSGETNIANYARSIEKLLKMEK